MTIARSEDMNKDYISILNFFKNLLVFANTSVQFYRGNSNTEAKFCTEVFVIPKH